MDFFLGNIDASVRGQPFVLALGGSYSQPRQTFVIIERRAFETKTLLGAVDLCYKSYQILDLTYPPQASAVWVFLDNIVYDTHE